jgi:hypothetical protein
MTISASPSQPSRGEGVTLFLPDTFPVPGRDRLRAMLEEAVRGGQPSAHLVEWSALVQSESKAKRAIDRFGRLFVLQHYIVVLLLRHPAAFRGQLGRLEKVLARYLLGDRPAGVDTIHKDLVFIRRRLGPDWMEAPDVLQVADTGDPPGNPAG